MAASNALRFTFLILAISMAVMSQDADSETEFADTTPEPEVAEAPPAAPAVEPRKDGVPSFGLCSKHTDCEEPNACFEETIIKKKFKICVTREFHAMPLDVKKKLKYPAHLL